MPGDDLFLTDDGDLEITADGDFRTTSTAATALRHQTLDELGAWVGDPRAGRRKVESGAINASERELEETRDSVREALRALEVEGMIADSEVIVGQDQRGRAAFSSRSRDTQSGSLISSGTLNEFGV